VGPYLDPNFAKVNNWSSKFATGRRVKEFLSVPVEYFITYSTFINLWYTRPLPVIPIILSQIGRVWFMRKISPKKQWPKF